VVAEGAAWGAGGRVAGGAGEGAGGCAAGGLAEVAASSMYAVAVVSLSSLFTRVG
jgi:hypothetical protein